ncbi:MAG: beta-lactamase hydrolase domain-containing protein [Candidatus Scalindua sp.]
MDNEMQISESITIGAQPSEEELSQLMNRGFKSIVNLRVDGENEQSMSPDEEGKKVKALGMEYVHIPVPSNGMNTEQVDRFRQTLKQLPSPVLVHCQKGKRAGALSMMHIAIESGWSGEETLQKAHDMGFQCDDPAMSDFVNGYIDSNH